MDSEVQKKEREHHFGSNEVSAYLLEMLTDRQEEFLAKVDADIKALENRVQTLEERSEQGKSTEGGYHIDVLNEPIKEPEKMNALDETATSNGDNTPENMDISENTEDIENG